MRASGDAGRRTARVEFLMPQGSGAARWARRLTRSFLAGHRDKGESADMSSDAELVVSELVANATRVRGSRCRMSLCLAADELTVEVHDDQPGAPRLKPASETAESGRGIALVHALAHDWGVRPRRARGQ